MPESSALTSTNDQVLEKLAELYLDLFRHDGYGDIRVELKIKKAGQKEVILHCGKQYRFFVDFRNPRRSARPEASRRSDPRTSERAGDEPRG